MSGSVVTADNARSPAEPAGAIAMGIGCTQDPGPLVLVVDDLESNALLLEGMLQAGGCRTLIATDGPSALEMASAHRPGLILLDLVMPGMSGAETCRRLKETDWGQHIPVLFVTGASDKDSLVDAYAAGGVDYLSKPVHPRELLARIGVHLRLSEAEHELEARNRELETIARELFDSNDRLAKLSRIDGLTGLLNRRTWDSEARQAHELAARHNRVYSVLMADVDLFKLYNDHYGHQAGDECLARVAEAIAKTLRQVDITGRYGGEEFVALLPETAGDAATEVAERVRETIWHLAIPHEKSPAHRVTVSIGVADSVGRNLATTIGAADHGLYMAKRYGRNVVLGPPTSRAFQMSQAAGAGNVQGRQPVHAADEVKHVLVVSTDAALVDLCRSRLGGSTYQIHHSDEGADTDPNRWPVDWSAMLLDLRTAEADIVPFLSRVRADAVNRLVPIIGICNAGSAETRRVLDHGFDDVIDDLQSDYQLKTRVATMCQLQAERAALEHSYQMRGEQVRILAYTVECAQRASRARTFEQACDVLLQGAAEIMAAQYTAVVFPAADRSGVRAVDWDAERENAIDMDSGYRLPDEVGAQLLCSDTVIEGASSQGGAKTDQGAAPPKAHACGVHIRLDVGGEQLGVLSAYRRRQGQVFTEQEAELFKMFACLAGSIISESLYHRARDEAVDAFVRALATTAETRDHLTVQHVHRVSRIAGVIAEQMRRRGCPEPISDEFIHNLVLAAPLHDIGKMAIPDAILKKPDKLTIHEMAIMKTHCELGVDLFNRMVVDSRKLPFALVVVDVILSHHERFDGRGYPQGLRGTQIPLAGRIVAVADAYDAITNDRVYRKARTHDEALKIIARERGGQFDPEVVDAFLECQQDIRNLASAAS